MTRYGFGPFREFVQPLVALQGEINRLIEQHLPTRPGAGTGPGGGDRPAPAWTPAIDVYETADEVVVLADLPGVPSAAIDLTVDGRLLTLRGDKPPSLAEGPASTDRAPERRFGPFHREIMLPSDVDPDSVRANANNGVLEVHLPKTESARARTIPIQPA